MSPAIISRVPQFIATNVSAPTLKSNYFSAQNESTHDWYSSMDSSLDFDLLAEYLLEDAGGVFDFNPEVMTPSDDQPLQAPGVVTPHTADTALADQLADGAKRMGEVSGIPLNGDLTGEFARVQYMIAQQQTMNDGKHHSQPLQPSDINLKNHLVLSERPFSVHKPELTTTSPTMNVETSPSETNAIPFLSNKRARVDPPVSGNALSCKLPSFRGKSTLGPSMLPATKPTYTTPFGANNLPSSESYIRGKSQSQIDRRRERNRILARRTRLRKKFFFESLQKDVADLQRENASLKSIVRSCLNPDDAHAILSTCNANERLPDIIHDPLDDSGSCDDKDIKHLDKEDFNLIQSIQNSQQCFIITDPSLHDNPIVYASDDFLNLTGYTQEEVLGRNCRFLQGSETSQETVDIIRKAVYNGEDCSVTLLNYTSNGTPFWNNLFIAALRDAENNIVNFIGVIVKVSELDSENEKVLNL